MISLPKIIAVAIFTGIWHCRMKCYAMFCCLKWQFGYKAELIEYDIYSGTNQSTKIMLYMQEIVIKGMDNNALN